MPRQLSLEEATALQWVKSDRDRLARKIMEIKQTIALLALSWGISLWSPQGSIAGELPLQKVEQCGVVKCLGIDEQLWNSSRERQALLRAIDYSLNYLNTKSAVAAYRNYSVPEITRDRVRRSLLRFRELLTHSRSPAQLQTALEREFILYRSAGIDGEGSVHFTGYFQPFYTASLTPTPEYRYPLYRRPPDLETWSQPHPTRLQLEGKDGLLREKSVLAGYELVWLRDRLEAYLIQVQGSARLQLTNGQIMSVGYAGSTNYPYTSIGRELVKEGIFSLEELTLPKVLAYFQANQQQLNEYLPRNDRFIFFQKIKNAPPLGSIGVPVTANRSIATDKSLMPPGALAVIRAPIADFKRSESGKIPLVSLYVLDQDTGSAIKGAGRVDIFTGTGNLASDRAGKINGMGELYYLLLRN